MACTEKEDILDFSFYISCQFFFVLLENFPEGEDLPKWQIKLDTDTDHDSFPDMESKQQRAR